MEKFWAVILIFVVVAAAGLMYVNQVYNPQKETQMAMADMANQTLTAVKEEIGYGTTLYHIRGDNIIESLEDYIDDQNEDDITIYIDDSEYNGDISNIEGSESINESSYYDIFIKMNDGIVTEIRIKKVD